MGLNEFMNLLFTNPLPHNYYIASIIILMISTGHIKLSVVVDLISFLLTSSFYQVIEWPMKLMIFIYAVIPTIQSYGFKYKFALMFLVVDLMLNTFLQAQVPLTSPMACFDDDEECCNFISFIEYEDRMTPADEWLEYLSRAIVAFYICCSIFVIVGKKAEILEYIQRGFRFLSANFILVLAVANTFLFLIQFKLQEITIVTLVLYMSCKLMFESWFPYPRNSLTADTQIVNAKMQGRTSSEGLVQDAVGSETVAEQSQASDGDAKDKPDDNQNEDSDDDAGENAEAEGGGDSDKNPDDSPDGNADDSDDNSDDSDDDPDENDDDEDSDDGDEDDEEDEDDEDDDDPERVPDVVDEDVDDDERCSLM